MLLNKYLYQDALGLKNILRFEVLMIEKFADKHFAGFNLLF